MEGLQRHGEFGFVAWAHEATGGFELRSIDLT